MGSPTESMGSSSAPSGFDELQLLRTLPPPLVDPGLEAEFDESWDSLGRHGVGSEPQLAELVRCCSQSSTSDARTGIGALQMDDAGPGTATLDDLIFVEPTLVSGADALGSIGPPHVEVSPLRIGAIVAEPSDADPDWPELHGPDELPFSCLLRNVNCFKPERKAPGPAPPAESAAGAAGATDFDPTDVLLRDGLLESLEAEKAAPPRAQAGPGVDEEGRGCRKRMRKHTVDV